MVKKVNYQAVKNIEDIEIRKYPKLLLATATNLSDNEAFGILFNYISGSNRTLKRIEMTAPVISTENSFSFVMPPRLNMSNIPKPNNPRVIIEKREASKIAVIRFRGYANSKDVNRFSDKLLSVLKKNQIKTVGETFLMRYNSPFAPGFIRRNEVGVKVLD